MKSEKKFIVRLIGSEYCKRIECSTLTAAKRELKKAYQTTLNNHDNGSWFDEVEFDDARGSFQIYGEEFYQDGAIIPANNYTGARHTVQEIKELADASDSYAACYQYELLEMQGVYDCNYEIQKLCDTLMKELAEKKPVEETYLDTLGKLTGAVIDDATIPEDVRKKADLLLAQLETLIFPYSG